MIEINRPKIPTILPRQGYLGYNGFNISYVSVYDFFNNTLRSGLFAQSFDSSTNWETFVNRSKPGWIAFLGIAARNQDASLSHDFFFRVTINGVKVTDDAVSLNSNGIQGGVALVGSLMSKWPSPANIQSIAFGYVPYDSLLIEVRNTVTNPAVFSVIAAGVIYETV